MKNQYELNKEINEYIDILVQSLGVNNELYNLNQADPNSLVSKMRETAFINFTETGEILLYANDVKTLCAEDILQTMIKRQKLMIENGYASQQGDQFILTETGKNLIKIN